MRGERTIGSRMIFTRRIWPRDAKEREKGKGKGAEGEKEIVVSPTSGCPWTDGVFQQGATAAIKAVANYAVYLETKKDEEEEG